MNKNELTAGDIEVGFEKTCICGCGQKFFTRNRKKKFKNSYHKHFYHYSQKLEKMKNQILIDAGNYKNFKVIRDMYDEGFRIISAAALRIRGYDPSVAPVTGMFNGLKAILYNDFALIGKDQFITIIKISTWRSSHK